MALQSILLWGVLIACQTVNFAVGDGGYCYGDSACGPKNWTSLCQNGLNQSPVNLPKLYGCYKNPTITTLILSKNCSELQNFTLTNDGNNAILDLHKNCLMTGGVFYNKTYVCTRLVFHWGSDSNTEQGSEHLFEGRSRSMEIQIICFKITYHNISQALMSGDTEAVVIIALMFMGSYDDDGNQQAKPIVSCLPNITYPGNQTVGSGLNLSELMKIGYHYQGKFDGVIYNGSMSNPFYGDCFEKVVTYIVKRVADYWMYSQIAEFFKLITKQGTPMINNYREPPQKNITTRSIECVRIMGVKIEGNQDSAGNLIGFPKTPQMPKPNIVSPSWRI